MKLQRTLPTLMLACLLASCGGKKESENADITPEVMKFYAETKNDKGEPFFVTKTIADLPKDLKWEDGADEKEFGSPDAKRGGTYRHYLPDYPRTLRVIGPDSNEAFRGYIEDYAVIPLLGRHPDTLKYIPGTASQWAAGGDKKTFYFKLDPDVHLSDGEKVTAANYFFTFFWRRYPNNQATWDQEFYRKKFENITKYDDHTISVRVASAKPDAMEYARSVVPVGIEFHRKMGKDYVQAFNWKFAPTTAAYEVKESGLKKGQSVTLTRVKDWWALNKRFYRQLFNPDRVVLEVIRDPDKIAEVFKDGQTIDTFRIRSAEQWHKQVPDELPQVQKGYLHKATFYNQTPRPTYGMYINTSRPLLNDVNIREGIHYASNWELVCTQVLYGDYTRLNLFQSGYGEMTDSTIKARPFDPVKAAECFAKAGFKERGNDGILRNAEGKKLSFTITNTYKRFESALVVIQQEAKKAGLELNIETPEATSAWKKLNEKKHDIGFTAFNIAVELYPRFWDFLHSSNAYDKAGKPKTDTNNFFCYADKETDEMIDRYDRSEDLAEIKDLALKLERKMHDAAVFVPAFQAPFYQVAYWRWVKWPATFDSRMSRDFDENWQFWIDEDERKTTQEAMKSGKTFEKVVKAYTQWKQ